MRFMVEAYPAAKTLSAKGIDANDNTCCRTPVACMNAIRLVVNVFHVPAAPSGVRRFRTCQDR